MTGGYRERKTSRKLYTGIVLDEYQWTQSISDFAQT
jgi:hypothetical protein